MTAYASKFELYNHEESLPSFAINFSQASFARSATPRRERNDRLHADCKLYKGYTSSTYDSQAS